MFYYKTGLIRRIRVHPQYIKEKHDPHKTVRKLLKQDVRENFFNAQHGYIVDRVCVTRIGDGYCLPLLGFVEYAVTFEAILYYPIVGEVIDALVEMASETCIIFKHICVYGVVRSYCLNDLDYFKYEERDVVPTEEKQQTGAITEGLFRSQTNSEKVIEKGTVIRIRITRRTLGGNGFFLVGSMSSEFLGPLKNPPVIPPVKALMKMPSGPSAFSTFASGKDEGARGIPKFDVAEDVIPRDELQKIWKQRLFLMRDSDNDDAISIASLKLDP